MCSRLTTWSHLKNMTPLTVLDIVKRHVDVMGLSWTSLITWSSKRALFGSSNWFCTSYLYMYQFNEKKIKVSDHTQSNLRSMITSRWDSFRPSNQARSMYKVPSTVSLWNTWETTPEGNPVHPSQVQTWIEFCTKKITSHKYISELRINVDQSSGKDDTNIEP